MRQTNLFEYFEVAKKSGKVHSVNEVFSESGHFCSEEFDPEEPVFIAGKEGDTQLSIIIFKNLYIILSLDEELNDRITQIYLKRPEDEWTLAKTGKNSFDLLTPSNVKIDVYVDYYVTLVKLNHYLNRCVGEDYKSGSWNKMFHDSVSTLVSKVEGYKEINQIKSAYAER
jgi:hypothetical protein